MKKPVIFLGASLLSKKTVISTDDVPNIQFEVANFKNLNACLGYIPDEYLRRWLMDVIHVKYDKLTDKVETKFHKGQWIVWQDECYKVNYGCGYELVDQNGLSILLDYGTIDENAHLWDITKDAKDGDVLVDKDDNIGIYKEIKGICWHSYIYLSFDNYLHGFSIGGSHVQNSTKPATKEQRDTLFAKMKEAGCMWDADKKELKKIEHKPAWSEEDETTRNALINLVEMYYGSYINKSEKNRLLSWLKSLRPQTTWKPSDEQLDALQYVYRNSNPLPSDKLGWNSLKTLELMCHDLKKLREE